MTDKVVLNKDIVIVVLTLNNEHTITRCLKSLCDQDYPRDLYSIIVLDNGSSDSTKDIVRSFGVAFHVFPKLTIGQLRNEGVRLANAPVVGFVDSDCEVAVDWISNALKHFEDTSVAIAGCMYRLPSQPTFLERHWIGEPYNDIAEHRLIPAGNMAILKRVFIEIGGFDGNLISGEDVYLLNKVRGHGYRTIYDPAICNIHYGNPKTLYELYRKEIWYGIRGDSVIKRFMDFDKVFVAAHLVLLFMVYFLGSILRLSWNAALTAWLLFWALAVVSALDRFYNKQFKGNLIYMTWIYGIYLMARMHSLIYVYGLRRYVYNKGTGS